jgi:hypothetical protein
MLLMQNFVWKPILKTREQFLTIFREDDCKEVLPPSNEGVRTVLGAFVIATFLRAAPFSIHEAWFRIQKSHIKKSRDSITAAVWFIKAIRKVIAQC